MLKWSFKWRSREIKSFNFKTFSHVASQTVSTSSSSLIETSLARLKLRPFSVMLIFMLKKSLTTSHCLGGKLLCLALSFPHIHTPNSSPAIFTTILLWNVHSAVCAPGSSQVTSSLSLIQKFSVSMIFVMELSPVGVLSLFSFQNQCVTLRLQVPFLPWSLSWFLWDEIPTSVVVP